MPQQPVPTAKSSSKSSKNSARSSDQPSPAPPRARVDIGKILRAHGVRGAVLVAIDSSVQDVLREGVTVQLIATATTVSTSVDSTAPHKTGLRVHFRGITDRSAAQQLTGATIRIEREFLPHTGSGEYYDFEIMGCEVVTPAGEPLGTVADIIVTGASDVFVVAGPSGEILVPVVRSAVLEIDLDGRRIVVEPTALEYSGSSRSNR